MKILRISFRVVIILVTILALTGFILASLLRRAALPHYNGEHILAGLNSDAKVIRDERGMPHIYASGSHDLYYLTGYVSAEERMWQMDLIRRASQGRLSEIFGKNYVGTDIFLRALNMTEKSQMVLAREDTVIISAMQAYVDGVNAWIAERGRRLPAEFRILNYAPDPWTLEDITNIIGYMGWELASSNLSDEILNYQLIKKLGAGTAAELLPDWKIVDEVVFPGFELNEDEIGRSMSFIASMDRLEELGIVSFSGSNNWAVSGKRSLTGSAILSNDMHLAYNVPGMWIQMHQVIPGELNVTGVMVPGQPFIIAGHNEKIAWGLTNLCVDDIDLFAEKVDSTGDYLYNGKWIPLKVREEIINIRGGISESCKIKSSIHGPVVSGMRNIDDAVLTMKWSGFDYSDELKAVYDLNRASDWIGFRQAISNFRSISQNFAYADVNGNIGMNTGGGIPLRKGGGMVPRNGTTDEFEWKGYVPFDLLPSVYNPVDGFVSSANQRTTCSFYPFYISSEFALPYRINRIREMASEKEMLGIDDFKSMITDNSSDYAAMLTPVILKAAEDTTFSDKLKKKAVDELKNWNYSMDADKVAPTLFEFIRVELARNLMADELKDLYGYPLGLQYDFFIYSIISVGPDHWVDNVNTPHVETLDDILEASINDAVDTLVARYGTKMSDWQWGKIHTITLTHPLGSVQILDKLLKLNSKKYPVGGSYHTVEAYSFNKKFKVNHGASERFIYNTANWDESFTIIPTGNSGITGSPFYLSQTETYIKNGFYKDPFTEAAVIFARKYEMVFKTGRK